MVTLRSRLVAACALWLCCAAYTWPFVTRGWIAHDEGTIAQSAERVLRGEVPHRDFDEVYTGGLSYLHAGAMKVFGIDLRASRFMLFGFFMVFVAAASWIAWRLVPGWGAALVTAVVVVWSAPNYFASLPSWYTLFFATFGLAAMLRFLETRHRGWLVLAGGWGGASMLMKITGIYYLGASLLFLVYLDRLPAAEAEAVHGRRRSWSWTLVGLPAGLSLAALFRQVSHAFPPLQVLSVLAPAIVISAFVVWREWRVGDGRIGPRVRSIATLAVPFVAGAALPVAVFVLWFWKEGAAADLLRGVILLPQRRLTDASLPPPPAATVGLAVPFLLLLLADWKTQARVRMAAVALAVALGIVAAMGGVPVVYRAIWAIARAMPLVAVVALLWTFLPRHESAEPAATAERGKARTRAVLLVTMAAFTTLVQLPYATPTYFCYAAPVTALAMASIAALQDPGRRLVHAVVALFFVTFAAIFMNPSYGWNLGVRFVPYHPTRVLHVDRGGLRVSDDDARTYEELVRLIRIHAAGGTIVAGPDCPEVYFLSGLPNPTRAFFDFLSPVREDEAWVTSLLARAPIRAAVINTAPLFSPPFDAAVSARIEARFPSSVQVGRFVLRFE